MISENIANLGKFPLKERVIRSHPLVQLRYKLTISLATLGPAANMQVSVMQQNPKALYVVGPSSTGKTTLCEALAIRLSLKSPAYIKEVARDVMRRTGYSRDTINQIAMQKAILLAQTEADQKARKENNRLLLSDRSAVDPVVYAYLKNVAGAGSLIRSAEFQKVLPLYRQSSFLLLKPIPEWLKDDGVRSLDGQDECYFAFKDVLKMLEIPFWEMDETCMDLEIRVTRALEALDAREGNDVNEFKSNLG